MVHPKTISMVNLHTALPESTPDPEIWVWDKLIYFPLSILTFSFDDKAHLLTFSRWIFQAVCLGYERLNPPRSRSG